MKQRPLTDLNRQGSNFMWKTLLIDCLINMDYKDYDNRDELVQILKAKYESDPESLNQSRSFIRNTKALRQFDGIKNQLVYIKN